MEEHSWNSEPEVGMLIAALIDIHSCKSVLEIGVFKGYTTAYVLSTDVQYTGIDIEDHREEDIKKLMEGHRFILGDSLKELDTLNDKFDLIFIDSVHEYDHCMAEFKKCESLINNGGLIVFHDSVKFEGVAKVIKYIKLFPHFDVLTLNTPDHPHRGGASGLTIVKCNYGKK